MKDVEQCTVKQSPPPGKFHVCSGVMPQRGARCPGSNHGGRQSVRLSSAATYDVNDFGGYHTVLFVADIAHVPTGCGVWPAMWLLGPNWPDGGEIDIIEGVNGQSYTQSTLHTSPGCTQAGVNSSMFSGKARKFSSCA